MFLFGGTDFPDDSSRRRPGDVNSTLTNTVRTELVAQHITFHHANTRGSRKRIAHLCVKKQLSSTCHVSFLHLTLTTSTSSLSPFSSTSPIFPTVSPSQTSTVNLNPSLPCDGPRQSGGSTKIPFLTDYEPKSVEFKDVETEAIDPEDLEPRKTELDRDLGTDPYQIQESFVRNSLSEDMEEFAKVGADTSYLQ